MKLTKDVTAKPKPTQLTSDSRSNVLFKYCIASALPKHFCFSALKKGDGFRLMDKFLGDTVDKNLTISQMETLYLRTKGVVKTKEIINGIERDVMHFGRDNTTFRIHGYYNEDSYFVITKIDPNHKVHKG